MIYLVVQNSKTGKSWEISELAQNITWTTSLDNQPGKLTFDFIDDGQVVINEGAPVLFEYASKKVFFGYVFKRKISEDGTINVTAYDQMRYLKNKDTYVIKNMTANEIMVRVAKDFGLKYRVDDPSWYKVPFKLMDNKTLFEMIDYGIDITLINTGNWYVVYDDFGTLVFSSYPKMATDYFIGDESGLTAFTYESSIDDDSYNQVKLVKENKETKKREIYIVKDSNKMKQWGILQYFETVDEKANFAQIKNRAEMLLKVKNRETKSLKLESIDGRTDIRAGSGVVVSISQLADEGFGGYNYFMVSQCTHKFTNDDHTMSLELRLTV